VFVGLAFLARGLSGSRSAQRMKEQGFIEAEATDGQTAASGAR
jgi:hypothetical protein